MAQINISENEFNKIKTICEFLFFDQYQDTASFTRFEKCFQPLFCCIENISFLKVFKDIVGPKKKYITYKRFLLAYINYKYKNGTLSNDTKLFFSNLFDSILKNEDVFVGKNLENNILYSTTRTCKIRNSITKLQVLNDAKGDIHGINLEYDGIYNVKMFPKSLEEELQIILEMKLDIINYNLFKRNIKQYRNNKNDLYRDAITHIFGTMNDKGFLTFIGFKCISGKTLFVGFPEGKGFLFGKFGKKIHDFKVQLNIDGITKFQPGFKNNSKTNYYLTNIKKLSLEQLNEEKIINDEEILIKISDEEELDKLITTDLIEDNYFFDDNLKDKFCGNDYKEIVNQYPRKWLYNKKLDDSLLINNVEEALEKYDSERNLSLSQSNIYLNDNNKNTNFYDFNPNPFLKQIITNENVPNPFFAKKQQQNINNNNLKLDIRKSLHNSKIFKSPLYLNDEKDKKLYQTQIIPNKKRLDNFFNKENYNNLVDVLAKDIHTNLSSKFKGDNNSIQRIFLDKLFPYKNDINDVEIISYDDSTIKVEDTNKNEIEENEQINIEEKEKEEEEDYICSNALIFQNKIDKNNKLRGFFKNIFRKIFPKKERRNDIERINEKVRNNWQRLKKGIEKRYGKNLFPTIGAVIKAMKIVNSNDVPTSEKIKLHQILKENENIFNFLNSNKNKPKEEKEHLPDILIPNEHPELITSLDVIQKNLETLKELKKKNLSKVEREKIESLYNLYFKQNNILIENEEKKLTDQLIPKYNINIEKYYKEQEEKRKKLIEEENKKIIEIESKQQLEQRKKAKNLLKESFYSANFLTREIFLDQTASESYQPWKDDKFIPEKKTLCPFDKEGKWILPKDAYDDDVKKWENIVWCKAEEIEDKANYQVILNEPNYENVVQGNYLQNCYFVAAVCSLCSRKNYIKKLFHIKTRSDENIYGVYLFLNGKWRLVLIDDYLPCMNINSIKNLCFGFSNCGNELWVSLLEKAWAKVNGSYINIGMGGFCNEAFDVLTDVYTEHITIPKNKNALEKMKNNLWEKLAEAVKHNYMVCLGTRNSDYIERFGLMPSHAYTLIKIYELKTSKGVEKVVKLRNPYGEHEYNGRWGDYSNAWTKELKEQCNFKQKEDGIFHMPYEDMLKYFCVIDIAKLEKNYITKFIKISKSENVKCQVIKMEIEKNETNCYINLYQKNPRIINKKGEYPAKPVLGYIILAKEDGNYNLEYIDSTTSITNSTNYQVHIALQRKLPPGVYYIFCDVIYRYNYEKNSGYTISVYSEHKLKKLSKVTNDINGNEYLKKVVYNCCKNYHLPKTGTKEYDIYKRNIDLKYPFISSCVFNKTHSNLKIKFSIDSEDEDVDRCFYCEENTKEKDVTLIKNLKPNSYVVCLTIPYDLNSEYKLKTHKIIEE